MAVEVALWLDPEIRQYVSQTANYLFMGDRAFVKLVLSWVRRRDLQPPDMLLPMAACAPWRLSLPEELAGMLGSWLVTANPGCTIGDLVAWAIGVWRENGPEGLHLP